MLSEDSLAGLSDERKLPTRLLVGRIITWLLVCYWFIMISMPANFVELSWGVIPGTWFLFAAATAKIYFFSDWDCFLEGERSGAGGFEVAWLFEIFAPAPLSS